MKEKNLPPAAMIIEDGEEIAGLWISAPEIPEVGFYKLMAKQKADGTCEWAHIQQRSDGSKKFLFRGEVDSKHQLKDVVKAVNKILGQLTGGKVKLEEAATSIQSIDGRHIDNSVN